MRVSALMLNCPLAVYVIQASKKDCEMMFSVYLGFWALPKFVGSVIVYVL